MILAIEVHRALPSKERQMVGHLFSGIKWVPIPLQVGFRCETAPAYWVITITYLFKGTMDHKDSLGNDVRIAPGDINLMSAWVEEFLHSERTGEDVRKLPSELFGIQSWIAQPKNMRSLSRHFKTYLQMILLRLIVECPWKSSIWRTDGLKSSIDSQWATLYLDVTIEEKNKFNIPPTFIERAIYIISGSVFHETKIPLNTLIVLKPSVSITLQATRRTRLLVLGGEPMDGPRYIYWNFVSSRKIKLKIKNKWLQGKFPLIINDKEEFIPLP